MSAVWFSRFYDQRAHVKAHSVATDFRMNVSKRLPKLIRAHGLESQEIHATYGAMQPDLKNIQQGGAFDAQLASALGRSDPGQQPVVQVAMQPEVESLT